MPILRCCIISLLLLLAHPCPGTAAEPLKMRPYSGIGVVRIADPGIDDALYLYQEPGLGRIAKFTRAALSGSEWVLGRSPDSQLLIVMGRKAEWLRVVYDDAGREAWIDPRRRGQFLPWEQFLKTQVCRMLPGLRKPFYLLHRQPGRDPGAPLSPRQLFKVLRVEGEWVMVMVEQSSIGWLRWRDEDGRLLLGLDN